MTDGSAKLIAVTGPTGAGKTTFVNAICHSELLVGNSLASCTQKVQVAHCNVGGERVTFIDTPGFDDTHKSQADILKDIADFLEQTYEKGKKLSGMIYMHRISDYRVGGIARENFRLFTKICGKNAMKNVIIVTTMWEEVPENVGTQREHELASKPIFFKEALDQGARMCRIYNTPKSFSSAIIPFLDLRPKALLMQQEIVDEQKVLVQTSAGTELQCGLQEQNDRHQNDLQHLQLEMKLALARKDATHRDEMSKMREAFTKLQEKMSRLEDDMKKLQEEHGRQGMSRLGFRAKLFKHAAWLRPRERSGDRVHIDRQRDGSGCLDENGFEV